MYWGRGRMATHISCWGRELEPTLTLDQFCRPTRGSAWSGAHPSPPTFTRMRMSTGSLPSIHFVTGKGEWWPSWELTSAPPTSRRKRESGFESILLSGFAAAALAVLLSLFLARSVTRPLNLMAESTAEIAAGNLNIRLNINSHDEVGRLAASFNQMVNRLSVAAADRVRMQQELLEKQKMDQELSLAAEIQRSFQPFAFPCSAWFCTSARTMPAEVVGGDFFDFIDLGDHRQGIAIGDVAGRGIAASIYLARLISDFRAAAARTSSPREALERLNQQLMMRATRGLFVTMTYLVLEPQTGQLCYATGGHLPMLRRSGATQEVEILYGDQGLPLGIENDASLVDRKIQLAAGDTLLLVTDGVVEALGPDRTEFKMERLAQIFRGEASGANQLVEDIFERIGEISTGPPEDDLTVLAITWTPQRTGVPR